MCTHTHYTPDAPYALNIWVSVPSKNETSAEGELLWTFLIFLAVHIPGSSLSSITEGSSHKVTVCRRYYPSPQLGKPRSQILLLSMPAQADMDK